MDSGRGRARGSQRVLQDQELPNYSGTCLTQSTWNVIVQSGWGEYYTEHREIGNAPISVTYSPLFSESKAPGSPRSTNMNGTDMSAVLLIIISIRLKEDQATASTPVVKRLNSLRKPLTGLTKAFLSFFVAPPKRRAFTSCHNM